MGLTAVNTQTSSSAPLAPRPDIAPFQHNQNSQLFDQQEKTGGAGLEEEDPEEVSTPAQF